MSVPTSTSNPELDFTQYLSALTMPRPETTVEEAAAAMPPPTHTITFLPPPVPLLTVQQLLAHTLPVVPPPSARSCGGPVVNTQSRRAHSSSKLNETFEPVLTESLHSVYPVLLSAFRDRMHAMSEPITFKDPLVLPWDPCSMLSEAMVNTYLDTQVLFAACQVVLRMVPAARNYYLEMVKQAPVDKGVPDQMFARITPEGPQILVIVEFKAPGIVTGMLSVIKDRVAGDKRDLTQDWIKVTQKLRKYAHATSVRHVIVLDEKTAIYFRFPNPPRNELDDTTYLVATSDQVAGAGIAQLSMRELVVFVLLRALDEKGVKLCDTPTGSTIVQANHSTRYRDVLFPEGPAPPDEGPEDNRKRARSSTGARQQAKRGKVTENTDGNDHGILKRFEGWVVNTSVQLEFLPDVAPMRQENPDSQGAKSPDSGFHDGRESLSRRKFHAVPMTRDARGRHITSLNVERIFTDKAAVLTTDDGSLRFIGKIFGLHPDTPDWFEKEMAAYAACAPLQGIEIPYLHGVCKVIQSSPFVTIIMLIEFIDPGTTIATLVYDAYFRYDTTDSDELARLASLQESGMNAVEALHDRYVIHNDLAGRSLVVSGEQDDERLVLVDFDCSMVITDNPRRFASRVSMDTVKFKDAFEPKRSHYI